MNRRYLLLLVAVCLLVGCVQAWGEDFGAWDYRKEITVNNTGSNLTNYQVLFTVNRSAGTDSGSTVYLNGKCESDYDDIRFTTSDENTLCDYWIESNSSTVATIWVEVPSIVNSTAYGSTTMYVYYGNSGASAVNNGTNTFPEFFDDFSSGTLDTSTNWKSPTSHSISGGVLQLNPTSTGAGALYSKSTHNFETYILRGRHKSSIITTSYSITFGFNTAQNHNNNNYVGSFAWESSDAKLFTMQISVAIGTTAIPDISNGADYYVSEIRKSGSTVYLTSVDSSGVSGSTSRNSYTGTTALNYIECEAGSGLTQYYDWVLMRKYTATEPTVSAWGSEEEAPFSGCIDIDFSGIPTSGYVPLTVYFTDTSVGYNLTVDTWSWSFGDTTPNSTSQNPAHTYTTSGLYTVGLTATNTSFSKTNSTTKTAYINATVNLDAPNADFTITETCGDIGDTFYFIDFSTGGGLYSWNWSFGDGAYSELRNPTHQYVSNGTYDVNLTVWGAYGVDSLLRENLITVPCGAPTPTPTPTPTGTITFPVVENVTISNATYIYSPDKDLVPFPIWLLVLVVTIAFFVHSIMIARFADITSGLSAVFSGVIAWLSNMITFTNIEVNQILGNVTVQPVQYVIHPPWLVYTMLIFFFVSIINVIRVWYVTYLKQDRRYNP